MLMTPEFRAPRDHPRTPKLWGGEIEIINNHLYCGKILILHAGACGSLHRHANKHETMLVMQGIVEFEYEGVEPDNSEASAPEVLTISQLRVGQAVVLPPGAWHRFRAISSKARIVEFSTPHDDADVERAEESRKL